MFEFKKKTQITNFTFYIFILYSYKINIERQHKHQNHERSNWMKNDQINHVIAPRWMDENQCFQNDLRACNVIHSMIPETICKSQVARRCIFFVLQSLYNPQGGASEQISFVTSRNQNSNPNDWMIGALRTHWQCLGVHEWVRLEKSKISHDAHGGHPEKIQSSPLKMNW